MSGHIWYSYGSDVSGPALAEKLGFTGGKKSPHLDEADVLVCWGCKPDRNKNYDPAHLRQKIANREIRVLNHPSQVSAARNKLKLISSLREKGVSVPGFIDISETPRAEATAAVESAVQEGNLILPIIGFNKHHKGKPVFCFSSNDVKRALEQDKEGSIHYFRTLDLGEEYRIHVFRDQVLYAEKKELAKDPIQATSEYLQQRLKKKAEREGAKLRATQQEVQTMVEELASDLLRGPSHMLRSTNHGWELCKLDLKDVPNEVLASAVQALEAAGLDIGAVHITVEEETPRVTNIISAPALDNDLLDCYAEAIQEFTNSQQESSPAKPSGAKKAAAAEEGSPASKEVVSRITRRLRHGRISESKARELLRAIEEE